MKRIFIILLSVLGFFGLFSVPVMAQDDGDETNNVIDEDGYYYVYTISGTTERGMTVINSLFCWDPLERANPQFIFRLEKAGTENQYYMYNLREDSWYWEITGYYSAEFKQGIENRAALIFDPQDDGKTTFKIRPVKNRGDYVGQDELYAQRGNFACDGSRDFPNNTAIYHPLGQWTGATWMVEKVNTAELKAAQMLVDLRKATQVYNDNTLYTLNDTPLITDVPADCDPATGQPGQFFSTCQRQDDTNSSFANLIDGTIDDSKRFQSTWDATAAPKPQYLQVDLSADDTDGKQVSALQLQIGLRPNAWGSAEFPTDITVYATNDEGVAEDMDITTLEQVSDVDTWVKIGDYDISSAQVLTHSRNGNWGQPRLGIERENVSNRWETKNIVFPDNQKYRFIRFFFNNTAMNASDNHDVTFCEFQVRELENPTTTGAQAEAMKTLSEQIVSGFAKVKAQTATDDDITALEAAIKAVNDTKSQTLAQLQAIVDSVKALNLSFNVGTSAGYNDSTAVANYTAALAAAEAGTHASLSDAEYNKLGSDLLTALDAAKNSVLPVTDGYYFFVNAYSAFLHTKAMIGLPTQNILGWENYDQTNPAELFKVTKTGEGEYSIQNVVTHKYINTIAGQSQEPTVTDTPVTPQTFTGINGATGQFNIANKENTLAYHTEYHQGGNGAKGYICTWNGGANSGSAWRLVQVTGTQLDSLLGVAEQYRLKVLAQAEIDTARTTYDLTYNYKTTYSPNGDMTYGGLITSCDDTDPDNCQIWAQQESAAVSDGYSSYANLIDGNTGTCFQASWSVSVTQAPQFFQVDLKDNPVSDFKFLFGMRNGMWGAWEQWTNITIYASNEEATAFDENITTKDQIAALDTWKKIGDYRLPEEYAKRNWSGNNRRIYVDVNHMGDKYRFIRFFINETFQPYPTADARAGIYDAGSYTVGEFQIYENKYDEANMPYTYVSGLKEAADNLKAQENTVAAAIEAGTLTQEQYDRLVELRKAVEALTPNTGALSDKIDEVKSYVNNFAAGEDYGDVSDAEWSTIQGIFTAAQAIVDKSQPSKSEVDAQMTALDNGLEAFKAAQIQFEPNKWYYIVSRCNTRRGSIQVNGEGETDGVAHTSSIYDTFIYGNAAYAASDNTYAAQGSWGANNNNALHWGYYDAGEQKGGAGGTALYTDNLDPHTMWRLIPIEGKDGQYAIQNRATGLFMTGYTNSSWISLTKDTIPYEFELQGSGSYRFKAVGSTIYMQFAGDGYVYSYNADTSLPNGACSFNLEPVVTSEDFVIEYPYNNSIFIKSLPYAIDATTLGLNEGYIDFYGVKGLEVVGNDSTLLLEKKTSVQAGEPFIGIAGDYEAFDAENATTATLLLPAVDAFSFEAKTVNGLTAVLDFTNLNKPGLGYFVNSVLTATQASTGIAGHTGYIDVKNMPLFTTTTDADQRIPLNGSGVDAIKSITTGNDGVVNVYSIDGKLIKKNVNSSKAGKGLSKGIYIIGKKKVTVK